MERRVLELMELRVRLALGLLQRTAALPDLQELGAGRGLELLQGGRRRQARR